MVVAKVAERMGLQHFSNGFGENGEVIGCYPLDEVLAFSRLMLPAIYEVEVRILL